MTAVAEWEQWLKAKREFDAAWAGALSYATNGPTPYADGLRSISWKTLRAAIAKSSGPGS